MEYAAREAEAEPLIPEMIAANLSAMAASAASSEARIKSFSAQKAEVLGSSQKQKKHMIQSTAEFHAKKRAEVANKGAKIQATNKLKKVASTQAT